MESFRRMVRYNTLAFGHFRDSGYAIQTTSMGSAMGKSMYRSKAYWSE